MKKKHPELSPAGNTEFADIAALIDQLSATEEALREAMENQVDTIILPGGKPYTLNTAHDVLQESQKALLASEKRFRTLIENSYDVISLIDADGNIVYSSPSLGRVLGYKPEERIGHNIFENIHPDDQPQMKQVFTQLLQQPGMVVKDTTRYLHKNGKYRYMEGYAKNLLEDPDVRSIVINFRDVTERREAEDRLAEKEKHLSNLILNLPGMVYRCLNDSNWTVLYLSSGCIHLTGYTSEQFVSNKIYYNDVIYPDDREMVWERVQRALDMQERYQIEYRIQTSDGEVRWVWEQGCGIFGENGEVLYLEGFIADINKRKQTEYALRESEQKYRTLIETANTGFLVVDEEGRVVIANQEYAQLTGHDKPEDIIGRKVTEWTAKYDLERNAAEIEECMKHGHVRDLEIDYVNEQGKITTVEINATVIESPSGPQILSICRDISNRKVVDKELQESERFANASLDGLSANIAVLDEDGTIIRVNSAWREFARENLSDITSLCEGANYLAACEASSGVEEKMGKDLASGIRAVLDDKQQEYSLEYPCHSPDKLRWFIARVTRFPGEGPKRVIVAHENITQRKLAEVSLQKSEQRFAHFMKNLPGVAFIKDKSGHYQFVNSIWKQFFAIDPGDVIGKTDDELWPPEIAQQIKEIDHVIFEKGEPVQIVEMVPSTRGKTHWLTSKFPIPDHNGNIEMLGAVAIDITERREAEEKLHNEVNFSNALLNSLPGIVYCYDQNLKFLRWNKNFERVLEYSSDEIAGMSPLDFFEGQERELMSERISEVFAFGMSDAEAGIVTKNGKKIPYYFTGNRIEIDGVTCLVGVGIDMTELKQAENELKRNQILLENAQRIGQMGSWELDVINNRLRWSEETYRIFGIDPEKFDHTYESFYAFIHPDDRKKMDRAQELAESGQAPLNVEYRIIRPDGKERVLYERGEFILDTDGSVIYKNGIVTDITERKHNEDALRMSESQLSNALKLARAAHWQYDVASNKFTFNDLFYAIFHTTAEEVGGYTMSPDAYARKFVHPDDIDVVNKEVRAAIETTEPDYTRELEHRILYSDGGTGYLAVRILVVKDEHGRTIKTYGVNQDITERKQTEQRLALLNFALDHAHEASYLMDEDSRFLDVNQEACRALGYSKEELLKMKVTDIDPDVTMEKWRNYWQKIRKEGNTHVETRHQRKDGRLFPVEITANYFEYDGKSYDLALARDITERKQAEEALLKNQRNLLKAQKLARLGNWEWYTQEDYVIGSDELFRIFAIEPQQERCPLHEFLDRIHPDDQESVNQTIQDVLAGARNDLNMEYRVVHPDGEIRHVIAQGDSVFTSHNKLSHLFGVIQDVTEQKQVEAALRESENRFRTMADSAPVLIWITNREGGCTYFNQGWTDYTGRIFEQEKGNGWLEGIHPDDLQHFMEVFNNSLQNRQPYKVEKRLRRADGEYRWFLDTGVPRYTDDGMFAGYIGTCVEITVLRDAQSAIRESELRFRNVARATSDTIWDWDLKADTVWWNEGMQTVFGYAPEEIEPGSESWSGRIHPEDRERVVNNINAVIVGKGDNWSEEYRFRRKDGFYLHIIDRGFVIRDEKGKGIRMVGGMTDVTEQMLAEQSLRKSELNLSEAQRIARLGSWELDLASGHLHWSNEVYRIFNLGKEEFDNTYEGFISHIHPDDREYIEKIQKQALAEKNEYNVEHRIVWPDGSIRWVNEIGEAERDENGQPVRFIGTVLDITERKAAEIALQNRDALLRAVGAVAKVGGWELDVRTRECVWTEEVTKINESNEPFGMESGLEYYQGESRKKIRNALDNAIKHGKPFDLELEMVTAKGNHKWIQSIARPVMENGKVIKLIGSFQDITSQHNLEEQLHQSQQLESIGKLTGGVAHDFNNLLTVILGNAELLTDRLASNKQLHPLAKMICNAAQRGAELTQRLLAFASKQTLEPRAININKLLLDMQKLLRTTLGEQVDISFKLQKDLWATMIDPGQLENALLNLCLNARDAMPRGGILTLETENKDLDQGYTDRIVEIDPGQYVVISVADTGDGIAKDNLTRIFEPFFTTKEKGKGTGLGLSMVYGFIRQSGGFISVYSEPEQGTIVKMYLPRVTSDTETIEEKSEDVPVTGGSETILLVEDDSLVRQYAHNQLLSLGYNVLAAEDGPQALEIIRQNRDIDLLFTDVIMPAGMNGPELAELALREQPHLKVLYTSGYIQDAFTRDGRLEEEVQLLNKPYGRIELAHRIRDVLDSDSES